MNGCLIWTGAKDSRGYGLLWFGGKNWWVHRLSFFLVHGSLPYGKDIHHSCEDKIRGRSDHLIALSKREHASEYFKKHGRWGAEKLSPAQVSYIRHSPKSDLALSREFKISVGEIRRISRGKAYAYIDFLRREMIAV